ncbi:zinc finger protein 675-like [Euwallacea similis]|uniref:zinc finger protein 675-like n=1 Tax=Euwallacea similis TaxID=1736056 RepID=UPI00344EE6C2
MDNKQRYHLPESPLQFPINPGTFSPSSTLNDIYSTLWPQTIDRTDNNKITELPYMFPESYKTAEAMEACIKDLSPNNFYGAPDNGVNTIENQYCRFENHQWAGNCNIKTGSYSSCAQMGKFYGNSRTTYCSIPKSSADRDMFRSCDYYGRNLSYPSSQQVDRMQNCFPASFCNSKYSGMSSESLCFNQNLHLGENVLADTLVSNHKEPFSLNFSDFPNLNQQAEASDESDIIVEDSSSAECSENEQQQPLQKMLHITKCIVCNSEHSLGLQFYVLSPKNPLTMSSQIPVRDKIYQFAHKKIFSATEQYLCNDCLGLINSIDHLQIKLENLMKSLQEKLKINARYTQPKKAAKIRFKNYKCKKCNVVLSVRNCLENHMRQKHKSCGFLCELCGKPELTYKRLKIHLKKHQKPNVTLIAAYKCSSKHCSKAFRTKFHLEEHENFCQGLLPFKCKNSHCNKKFASATKLKNHTKLKHDKKFIAICSICNIGFVKSSDYKSHMTSHGTEKKFPCSKCEKAYKTLSNLNFHLKSHEKKLPHVCLVCQKGFMRKEYFEAHMNNHKGVKNYSCAVCQKKFVSQKNLDAHMKYHDGTVKSNLCNICRKVVTSNFEEHLRVHLNLKEFECESCNMKFNTKNSLSKHKKKKHFRVS